jgi:NAD(P)H-dependent flavin oxidoreductase YrpB (nitropropane dioxygenase family)
MARDLANEFTKKYLEMRNAGAGPEELSNYLNENGQYQSQFQGEADEAEICCGQVAGLISEVQSAGDVMSDIVETISTRFEELQRKVNDFF